ncbi:MAG: GAF domain-containing protein [Anaerolineae bacterium]|nr:GAF domain-containing protein [Anaerolineae bacterium]
MLTSSLMTESSVVPALIALICAAAYGVLLAVLLRSTAVQREVGVWLLAATAISLLSVLPRALLSATDLPVRALGVYLLAAAMLGFSRLSMRFLRYRIHWALTMLGAVWFVAAIASGLGAEALKLGTPGWELAALQSADLPALLVMGGWIGLLVFHLVLTVQAYRRAHLPELSNRTLFWGIVVLLFFISVALGASGSQPWSAIGWVLQVVTMLSAAYGITHRIYDIQRSVRQAVRFWMVSLVIAIALLGLLLIITLRPWEPSFVGLLMIALVAAVIAAPLFQLTDWLVERALERRMDPAQVLRRYSQEIVGQIDLDRLATRLVEMLTTILKVRRSTLILARAHEDGTLSLNPLHPELSKVTGVLNPESPIYHTLCNQQRVLLQYDLEYERAFASSSPDEHAFFEGLQMNAYAPVIVGNELIGILACGSKIGDAPFYPQELELLATIANQTGIALRNARLVADLRKRETEMMALNENLNSANAQLAKLDSVKSDFITIASHELRTPLAQIRGYTDIVETFNDQGMLEEHIVKDMTAKLRKATARLEVLISDMLDVSQLDVDAMDLRFVETRPVSIIRMAIDPLTDAIKERSLTLAARGLSDLPPIKADLERLVQAFRNIIINAIKYTPDSGSIEIRGRVSSEDADGNPVEVEIAVADAGVGIAPEHQELIFEKFFRGIDPSLHSTGTTKFMGAGPGLGLTIARGVIEGHGGRIYCESPGFDMENFPGSTFYVILPVVPPEDASRVLPFETTGAATPSPVS